MTTHTYGGVSQRPGADNSTEAKRKRAKRRADAAARQRASSRPKDGRRILGSGQARRAADKLKAREAEYQKYWDDL